MKHATSTVCAVRPLAQKSWLQCLATWHTTPSANMLLTQLLHSAGCHAVPDCCSQHAAQLQSQERCPTSACDHLRSVWQRCAAEADFAHGIQQPMEGQQSHSSSAAQRPQALQCYQTCSIHLLHGIQQSLRCSQHAALPHNSLTVLRPCKGSRTALSHPPGA